MRLKQRPFLYNLIFLVVAFTLSLGLGAIYISPITQMRMFADKLPWVSIPMNWPDKYEVIMYQIRLPHTILMCLTGAALASSGAAYQGLFRNPLADPYLIGAASGAGLGAVVAMTRGLPYSIFGYVTVPAAAFIGALSAVLFVYALARSSKNTSSTTLILAGVATSSFATSLTAYLMFRSTGELRRAFVWIMGGAALSGWKPVLAMAPYVLIGIVILILLGYALNVLQFGDEQAGQIGLQVENRKRWIILSATVTTAAAVAFAGIIGFVGLVVPHIIRIIWGSDYRRLIPLSVLGGATMLLLADTAARIVLSPQVLPVGVVTALFGAPFFLWILWRAGFQARNEGSG